MGDVGYQPPLWSPFLPVTAKPVSTAHSGSSPACEPAGFRCGTSHPRPPHLRYNQHRDTHKVPRGFLHDPFGRLRVALGDHQTIVDWEGHNVLSHKLL